MNYNVVHNEMFDLLHEQKMFLVYIIRVYIESRLTLVVRIILL